MTDVEEAAPPAAAEGGPVDVKEKLTALATATRSAAARGTRGRRTTAKKTTAKKTTTSAPKSPAGVRRQKYGDRIVGWAKLGATVVAKDPVTRALLQGQAAELGPIVDSLAEEDPRVAQVLDRFFGFFGKGGAWAKLGGWAVGTGGAVMMVRGYQHPLLAIACGSLVERAVIEATFRQAEEEARRTPGKHDPATGNVIIDPARLDQIRDELLAGMFRPMPEAPTTAVPDPGELDPFEERDATRCASCRKAGKHSYTEGCAWQWVQPVHTDERYDAGPVTVS